MIINGRIDMAVSNDQILPPVIVVIKKTRAPTEKRNRNFAQAGQKGHIGEIPITVVVIQNIRIIRKVRDVKINLTIVVIVSDGDTHSGLFPPILIKRDA